jgi:hypothetical protein
MDEPEHGAGIEDLPDHEPPVIRASPVDGMETEGEPLTKGGGMRGMRRRRSGKSVCISPTSNPIHSQNLWICGHLT